MMFKKITRLNYNAPLYMDPAGTYDCCQSAGCPQAATAPCRHMTYDEVVVEHYRYSMEPDLWTACEALYEAQDQNLS